MAFPRCCHGAAAAPAPECPSWAPEGAVKRCVTECLRGTTVRCQRQEPGVRLCPRPSDRRGSAHFIRPVPPRRLHARSLLSPGCAIGSPSPVRAPMGGGEGAEKQSHLYNVSPR